MPTIQDQLQWEDNMATRGVERFRNQQALAAPSRAHETSAGSRLLRSYVLTISDRLKEYLDGKHPDGRRRNKFAKFLDTIDTDKVAMLALRGVISAVFNSGVSVAGMCSQIGRQCEDELRLSKFQSEHKEYYDTLIRDMERKRVTSYNHKRRVLNAKGSDQGVTWKPWADEEAFGVGALALSLLMEVCNLVEVVDMQGGRGIKKASKKVVPTQACIEWITKHDDIVELTSPDRMPCLIPPDDWTSVTDGGFWSPNLRRRTPLIKSKAMTPERQLMYAEADMPGVLSAVNAMQKTAWAVNTRVQEVMTYVWAKNLGCGMPRSEPYEFPDCPLLPHEMASEIEEGSPMDNAFSEWKAVTRELHTLEKERIARNLALVRTMRLAREMAEHEQFWYVYQCDFRGRVYAASAGLTPQGTDQSKSLIQFSKGEKLYDQDGIKWFCVNGANKFGYDKATYADRVTWVSDNRDQILRTADNPTQERGWWSSADKPYQFLAWVFEAAEMLQMADPTEFVSRLPVGLDGSCNGLQHFSAMLSDEVGGASVNLLPSDLPSDIYQDVADVCYAKLVARGTAGEAAALNWLTALGDCMSRKLPKTPVMTLPYGSTQQACTASIYVYMKEYLEGRFDKNTYFKHAIYLNPLLWESIGEVVIAARSAMAWIQKCSREISAGNSPLKYYSPLGFPVLQASMKYNSRQIETQIGGRLRVSISSYTDQIDSRKQRQGSSPNLVHHIDACHMMMVINACHSEGITYFSMIHDDFGVPARYAENLQRHIREQFVALYSYHDVLASFKEDHEAQGDVKLPPVPARGNLDIREVIKSPFFFG